MPGATVFTRNKQGEGIMKKLFIIALAATLLNTAFASQNESVSNCGATLGSDDRTEIQKGSSDSQASESSVQSSGADQQ